MVISDNYKVTNVVNSAVNILNHHWTLIPSLCHNSKPLIPSSALKNRVLLKTTNALGKLDPAPELMSLTVPEKVPSVCNSLPSVPSVAENTVYYQLIMNNSII